MIPGFTSVTHRVYKWSQYEEKVERTHYLWIPMNIHDFARISINYPELYC